MSLYKPSVTSETILIASQDIIRKRQEYSAVIARQSFNRICQQLEKPNGYTFALVGELSCLVDVAYEIEHDITLQREFDPEYYKRTVEALLKTRGFDETFRFRANLDPIQTYTWLGKRRVELSQRKVPVILSIQCTQEKMMEVDDNDTIDEIGGD